MHQPPKIENIFVFIAKGIIIFPLCLWVIFADMIREAYMKRKLGRDYEGPSEDEK